MRNKQYNYKENNPRWKGGRWLSDGYVMVYIGKQKYIREHRLIMENKLGRKLRSCEIVHHKNGSKIDNRISNLKLMEWGSHSKLHMLKNNPFKGKHHNSQTKRIIGLGMKKYISIYGHPRGMLGKKHSEKVRLEMSKRRIGNNYYKFRKHNHNMYSNAK